MGAVWETVAFIFHSVGSRDQQQIAYATAWQLLFLLAPLWINAFAYMTFARMVLYWHPEGKVVGFRAAVIARWFVLADIFSFIVQATGGIMASPDAGTAIIKIGLNIYLGGMGLQQLFIFIFLGLMIAFQRRCAQHESFDVKRSWKPLLFGLYGVLVCITVSHPLSVPVSAADFLDPGYLSNRGVRRGYHARQPSPVPRSLFVRARLLPHDDRSLYPRCYSPWPLSGGPRERIPSNVEKGEEGAEAGEESCTAPGERGQDADQSREKDEQNWRQRWSLRMKEIYKRWTVGAMCDVGRIE